MAFDSILNKRITFFRKYFVSLFRDNRDLYDVFGYPDQVKYENCLALYNRGGIAKRIVNMPASAVWSKPPILMTEADLTSASQAGTEPTKSTFRTAWEEILTKYDAANVFASADKLAGMGEYSVIHYGFDDVKKVADLAKPVKKGSKLTYLRAFSVAAPCG